MSGMPKSFTILMGKAVRYAARLRGGGSALPGLFVERISPQFVSETLAQLPRGVIVVSGTNGKTTTTKAIVALLESQGLRVFTNRTGSNFVRGVAAALLGEVDLRGALNADIAVLELDEAHAVKFVEVIPPRYSLLLNVMRDQLDRFGEIDATARMLQVVADATTEVVIANREDERLQALKPKHARTAYFGLSADVRAQFPTDDELHMEQRKNTPHTATATVILKALNENEATFEVGKTSHTTSLKLTGAYNAFNAAAALAVVHEVLPDSSPAALIKALSEVQPAFGRGEKILVNGQSVELVLVKNPAGFRLALESYDPAGHSTLIAINDEYADGRDMSWLWDVSFTSLNHTPIFVTGIRAYDMALRLQYDEVPFEGVSPNMNTALKQFLALHPGQPKRIYCTYTAMFSIRKKLAKIASVETIS